MSIIEKIKTQDEFKHFCDYNEEQISIKGYLPIEQKKDLIDITLQKSKDGNIYNPIKVDMYFHTYLVFMYTNIEFTDEEKFDIEGTYDALNSSGLLSDILTAMPLKEYDDLVQYLNETIELKLQYDNSISGVINKFINDIPMNAEAMNNVLKNFDSSQFQEVINFATAANGGRPLDYSMAALEN